MARQRTATVLKIMRGTARKDRMRDESALQLGGTPHAVDIVTLDERERTVFDWLVANGTLPTIHSHFESLLLMKLAKLIVLHNDCEAKMARYGLVMRTSQTRGELQPYYRAAHQTMEQIRVLMNELGLTPAARLRFAKPMSGEGKKGDDDEWSAI